MERTTLFQHDLTATKNVIAHHQLRMWCSNELLVETSSMSVWCMDKLKIICKLKIDLTDIMENRIIKKKKKLSQVAWQKYIV